MLSHTQFADMESTYMLEVITEGDKHPAHLGMGVF